MFVFLKYPFFYTKFVPFLLKIREDFKIDDYKGKGLELMKIVFITLLSTFGSKVLLILKIMGFENVPLIKVVHNYVIKGMNAYIHDIKSKL